MKNNSPVKLQLSLRIIKHELPMTLAHRTKFALAKLSIAITPSYHPPRALYNSSNYRKSICRYFRSKICRFRGGFIISNHVTESVARVQAQNLRSLRSRLSKLTLPRALRGLGNGAALPSRSGLREYL